MPCPNLLKVVYLRLELPSDYENESGFHLASFACLGVLSEIAASSTQKKMCKMGVAGLHEWEKNKQK